MLLDDLPPELCERIATYSSNRLYLAEVSFPQRTAVMSALRHTLELLPITEAIPRWCNIAHQLQHLRIPHPLPQPHVVDLLSTPSLRSVEIPDNLSYLHALPSTNITTLIVRIFGRVDSNTLFSCLSTMHLIELRLLCMHRPHVNDCPVLYLRTNHSALYHACPNLRILEINCWLWRKQDFWKVIQPLKLQQLTLTTELPEQHISNIAKIPSLCLESRAVRMAHKIGSPVTTINGTWLGANPLSITDVIALKNCPRLQCVYIDLEEHAEHQLPNVLGSSLQSLSLTWNFVHTAYPWKNPYTITPGSILNIISVCENLKELTLPRVIIHLSEIQQVLKQTAHMLQLFEMDVAIQKECSCHYVLTILETATRYNKNLRHLRLHVRIHHHFGAVHSYPGVHLHQKSLTELLLAADRLHQYASSLNIDLLKQLIVKIIDIPCHYNHTLN